MRDIQNVFCCSCILDSTFWALPPVSTNFSDKALDTVLHLPPSMKRELPFVLHCYSIDKYCFPKEISHLPIPLLHLGAACFRSGCLATWLQSSCSHGPRVFCFLFPPQPYTSEKLWSCPHRLICHNVFGVSVLLIWHLSAPQIVLDC